MTATNTRSIPPPITLAASEGVVEQDATHKHRRRFIGPMPAAVLAPVDLKRRRRKVSMLRGREESGDSSDSDDSSSLSDVIHKHALQFFLKHGGKRENWGESQAKSVRAEMRRRWQESDWGRARKQRRQTGAAPKWVGTSFDVGVFLGVDILEGSLTPLIGSRSPDVAIADSSVPQDMSVAASSPPVAETFVTARSNFSMPIEGRPRQSVLSPNQSRDQDSVAPPSANSSTALLAPSGSRHAASIATRPASSADRQDTVQTIPPANAPLGNGFIPSPEPREPGLKDKGKGKGIHVHYEDPPAPPAQVLARRGTAVLEDTSAGAAAQATAENRVTWGDVIMRDRMLVRVSYTEDTVPMTFDESRNRTTRHLENEGWVEYIVAWRKDRLELYTDHHTPGKEWFTGHKRLAHLIPLGTTTTRLSLYSFVDLTFCLTCPPTRLRVDSKPRRHLFGASRGTNIFVFKMKCRSRAVDWVWQLWRHLGGQLPPYIEIRSPTLDTRIKIDVPDFDNANIDAAYTVFTRENILHLCEKYLRTVPEFRTLMEREHADGATFELAWRIDTNLDWVWRTSDVLAAPRKWAVLCGLALAHAGSPAHLEFRRKRHVPTRLHMRDGTRLDEPPAVEGFLDRIRPNSQMKQSLYLATHDGYLFSMGPAHAHPPPPPGAVELSQAVGTGGAENAREDSQRRMEVRRGQLQILEASGVSDLRSIVAVRRAFQLVPPQTEHVDLGGEGGDWEDTEAFWTQVDRSESDDEDAGGDVGFARTRDKSRLRMRRSFELVLTSGRVLRFEAYSCATALEWIIRLRPLISYWKKRHEYDARLEMDIAHVSTGRPRITPQRLKGREQHGVGHGHDHEPGVVPENPLDRDATLPDLDVFYNWCVLDGCLPILRCGRLYGRKGWWGQYRHIQLVLISGHLVQYRITGHTSLHHKRDKVIPLLDAYLCSGYFAAQYLPEGQYDANAPPVARRYQDGLETEDGEEDTLFVLWYRIPKGAAPGVQRSNVSADVPPLTAKRKAAVFRTRSKLERDAWVWAINVEIEKVVRASSVREEAVRNAGELLKS